MAYTVEEIIKQAGELPPLPAVAQKAIGILRNPKSNMSDLADVLILDQAMTGLILRWVNSAYFGLWNPVATVHQAVVYLGQRTLESLVLAASVVDLLSKPIPGYGLEQGDLWKHSIGVAAGARLIAKQIGFQDPEIAYHAGLLCDIGKLVLGVLLMKPDVQMDEWVGKPFSDFEESYFGVDHATLGSELARQWNLPEPLQVAIACHHRPSQAGDHVMLASIVHISDAMLMMMGIGLGKDGLQYTLDPNAFRLVDWKEARINDMFERVMSVVQEAENLVGMKKST
jgi:putative nucleotidyltransferase with HDIG domain